MPKRYRLIPIEVEALQLTPDSASRAKLWCGGIDVEEIDEAEGFKRFIGLNIPTKNGVLRAYSRETNGDYIVKDPQGDFLVKSAEEFEKEYELIQN